MKIHLRHALTSALAFGAGFVIGAVVVGQLLENRVLEPVRDLFQADRLVTGVVLLIVVVAINGAIGGAMGGLALSYVHKSAKHVGYAWRAALSFGFSYGVILIPLTIAVSLFSFYNPETASPIGLIGLVGLIGIFFGAVSGLILGLLTVARDTWRVFLVSTLGFAISGAALGYGLWGYFFGPEDVRGTAWALYSSLFVFGFIGGGFLGYLYSWLARRTPRKGPPFFRREIAKFRGLKPAYQILVLLGLAIAALVVQRLWIISPFKVQAATLSPQLKSRTIDTHWLPELNDALNATGDNTQPDVFADGAGNAFIAWANKTSGASDIYYAARHRDEEPEVYSYLEPVNVSNSGTTSPVQPQIVADSHGNAHLVWTEQTGTGSDIFYSQCTEATCTPPVSLSGTAGLACVPPNAGANSWPAIAIDNNDTLMVVWNADDSALIFNTWSAAVDSPPTPAGCIPINSNSIVQQPRLATTMDGNFRLVFDGGASIYLTEYSSQSWSGSPDLVGQGRLPEIYITPTNRTNIAWCTADNRLNYWTPNKPVEEIEFPFCITRPEVGQSGLEQPRLVWYSDEVKNVSGITNPRPLIFETVRRDNQWSEPAIVAHVNDTTQPAMVTDNLGTLHLIWSNAEKEEAQQLQYHTHTQYDCSEVELSPTGQVVLDVQRQTKYRPPLDIIPYCHNQYEGLVFAPNPEPAFSADPPTPNGGFDQFAALAKTARYEVNFSTMWYDADQNQDSPGSVLAQSIAHLYRDLKENPSRYPRGLTVRILLGNPPQFILFPMLNHQVANLIEDMQAAGIPEMQNPAIGWNLEVANFDGSWPHSHTKLMVVDGKSAIAVGFNMQYSHFPADHSSQLGTGRVDLGVKATGPIAQASLLVFDDLWGGSDKVNCPVLDFQIPFVWRLLCDSSTARADHLPEVLRFYVPDANNNAFSLYRTEEYREADEVYAAALASAQSSIDTIQVNFTLDAICDLGVLIEVCNFNNSLDYMQSMMNAIENNGATARILVEEGPIDGIENKIAIDVFQKELEKRGLSDQVEIRYFDGDVHIKAALIDDEFLVVGSQNYHYSAWEDGLTEYSLAFDDPDAAEDFKRMFEYRWAQGKPVE